MKLMFSKMIHHILSLKISRWGLIQYTMCLLSSLGRIDFGTKIMTLVECLHQIFQITSKKKNYGQGESFFEKNISNEWEKKLYEICWLFIRCNSSCPIPSTFSFFFLYCFIYLYLTMSDSCQTSKQNPFLYLISVILTNPCEIKLSQFSVTSRILSYQFWELFLVSLLTFLILL